MAEVPISEDMHRGTALNSLKYAAIAAMTVDHIAYAFVPNGTVLALVMHFFGRITGPVMFFSAVEGYHHTRNLNRYLFRLAAFAAISWFPFLYFRYGGDLSEMAFMRPNVIYTIFMGVLAIKIRRSEQAREVIKVNAREIEKCIDAFGTDIYRFCLKLCADKADAEDLYQQTFLKALETEWTLDWEKYPKALFS